MYIFTDEVGYRTEDLKRATVLKEGTYTVVDAATSMEVYSGEAVHKGVDRSSGDDCYTFDFTPVFTEGTYYILGPDKEKSDEFRVDDDVYSELRRNLVKALYYQRCGCGLDEKYAGVYKHGICHTGKAVMLEDYINSNENTTEYDVTGGWHDAGDFGRYISPAGVAVGHLLYAFELFTDKMGMDLNIPESGNGVPDILNEVRYELEWMLKMQAPDGGAYHKLTTFKHADFIMPEADDGRIIIYPVSSMATADFCASMALASRIYRNYDEPFAERMLKAAGRAFDWLENNGYVGFKNPEGSNTGEYDDECDNDERMWAAAEMLRSDLKADPERKKKYKKMLETCVVNNEGNMDFGWTDVSGFALLTILTDCREDPETGNKSAGKKDVSGDIDLEKIDSIRVRLAVKYGERIIDILIFALFSEAEHLAEMAERSGYGVAMEGEDFVWGSNMVVANRGMLLILASMLAADENACRRFENAALGSLHYLLGRNAMGISYITGFGGHAFKNPHNRVTACDGIDDPMPGWVSGGPFFGLGDEAAASLIKKGTPPMKCYADVVESYSTNEITIYWNSPVFFIAAFF